MMPPRCCPSMKVALSFGFNYSMCKKNVFQKLVETLAVEGTNGENPSMDYGRKLRLYSRSCKKVFDNLKPMDKVDVSMALAVSPSFVFEWDSV